jgi:hypothetical protein
VPVRIIIGLLVTVIGFGIAARRFHWLSKLIRSGKKDPNRSRGPISRKVEAETVEVAGQRKLLQWTVPGLAHFFTMWGFTILLLTIIGPTATSSTSTSTSRDRDHAGLGRLHRISSPSPC